METNEVTEDTNYEARLTQYLAEKPLFEERIRIIDSLPKNAIANEVEEIYLKYKELNKLSEDGEYIENSKLVDSNIKVEVKDAGIICYYFDGQVAISYKTKLENTNNFNTPIKPFSYSSLNYSGNLVSDPSPTQVRSI
jgi:hypothetical protein